MTLSLCVVAVVLFVSLLLVIVFRHYVARQLREIDQMADEQDLGRHSGGDAAGGREPRITPTSTHPTPAHYRKTNRTYPSGCVLLFWTRSVIASGSMQQNADHTGDQGGKEDHPEDDGTGDPQIAGLRSFGGLHGSHKIGSVRLNHKSPFRTHARIRVIQHPEKPPRSTFLFRLALDTRKLTTDFASSKEKFRRFPTLFFRQ